MRKLLLLLLLIAGCARHEELQVAAAASLQDVLSKIGADYERQTHEHVSLTFDASSTLAQQIRGGAPVDVFFSADERTMDQIAGMIAVRQDLLSNELVVVSRKPLHNLLTVQRLALGDPDVVPAGVYAREYFERNGMWDAVQPRVIPMPNVRAALAAADNGSVDAAVVYRTDALLAKRAQIVMTLPGPVIHYPIAILRDAKHADKARRFVDYLASPDAAAVFKQFGFVVLAPPAPHRFAMTLATRSGERVAEGRVRGRHQPLATQADKAFDAATTSSSVRQNRG